MSLRIPIVPDDEAAKADFWVCMRVVDMPVAQFADDVIADCALGCGFAVRHRPYAPPAVRKACLPCVQAYATETRQ